ncbi:MAG: hypothetical protein R3B49_05510 [Phycisphaerales bacterium]
MQLEIKIALFGGVVPGVVALATLLPAWWRAKKRGTLAHAGDERPARDGPVWLAPVLVFVAFAGADYAVNGPPHWWTPHGPYRFIHAVGLMCALGVLEGLVRVPVWIAAVLRAAALAGVVWMLGSPYSGPDAFVPTHDYIGWMLAMTIGGSAAITLADRGAQLMRGAFTPIVLLALVGGAAKVAEMNTLGFAAQTAPALVAVLTNVLIVSAFVRGIRLDRGGVTAVLGVVYAWLAGTYFQAYALSMPVLVLVALSPIGLACAAAMPKRPWPVRLGVCLIVTGVCLGAAAWVSTLAAPAGDDSGDPDPYAGYVAP